jgi:hypothetical protein
MSSPDQYNCLQNRGGRHPKGVLARNHPSRTQADSLASIPNFATSSFLINLRSTANVVPLGFTPSYPLNMVRWRIWEGPRSAKGNGQYGGSGTKLYFVRWGTSGIYKKGRASNVKSPTGDLFSRLRFLLASSSFCDNRVSSSVKSKPFTAWFSVPVTIPLHSVLTSHLVTAFEMANRVPASPTSVSKVI